MMISRSDPGSRYVYRIFSAEARKSSRRGWLWSPEEFWPGELESLGEFVSRVMKLGRGGRSADRLLPMLFCGECWRLPWSDRRKAESRWSDTLPFSPDGPSPALSSMYDDRLLAFSASGVSSMTDRCSRRTYRRHSWRCWDTSSLYVD
jgi:hypothetical protein